jgi:ubiquitin carboxyl-terminal hydrolase 4/11/15
LQEEARIEDLQMGLGDFFVVELKEKTSGWFLKSDNDKKCEGCYALTELKFPCLCEKVAYCTEKCK